MPVPLGLFAFPAQSKFSGVRHPLEWVGLAQARGYRVLLDVAAYVPAHPFSLREVRPDFAALSIYKMCGYPTGVGALVARRDALRCLVRPALSGGTVGFASVLTNRYLLKQGGDGFEDGTGDFLAWSAVPCGLRLLGRLGMRAIEEHVSCLTDRLLRGLAALRHPGGAPAVRIHGPNRVERRGGTVAFNVLDAGGTVIDYERVVDEAADEAICRRGGCFCNPGCAERAFDYSAEELAAALDEALCGIECASRVAPRTIARRARGRHARTGRPGRLVGPHPRGVRQGADARGRTRRAR
jgi:selenocysteine lyase/cysteine desulfurase